MSTKVFFSRYHADLHSREANKEWLENFNALFMMDIALTRQCESCDTLATLPPGQDDPRMGFTWLPIKARGRDTLWDALRRHKCDIVGELPCAHCGEELLYDTIRVTGAPEILRVKLNVVNDWDPKTKSQAKNKTPVTLPETLDITHFQGGPAMHVHGSASRLMYTLSSVLPHIGKNGHSGHWVATVRGEEEIFAINDDEVALADVEFLKSNPQDYGDPLEKTKSTQIFQAVFLTYVRRHPSGKHPKKFQRPAYWDDEDELEEEEDESLSSSEFSPEEYVEI